MSKLPLILILLLALFMRTWNLNQAPASLYWDEMDVGYQAYSLLKTGKDYFGSFNPLVTHSFADFRAPLLIYSTIPFVAILGLNSISVRLPAAIFGTISVLLIYILTLQLFNNRKTALIAALLTALAPWNIHYSRMAFEATLMLSLFLTGLTSFLRGLTKPKWFIASSIFFGLSLFAYNTAKLFVPLILLVLVFLYLRTKQFKKNLLIPTLIFGLIYMGSLYGTVFLNGGQRFSEVSVFTDPQIVSQIDRIRYDSGVSYAPSIETGQGVRFLDKILYNKVTYVLDIVARNYLQAFSTHFLYLEGDPNLRHSTSKTGEFYPIEILTIFAGLIVLVLGLKKHRKSSLLLLIWILIAPLSAVVTRDGGTHASRLFFLFPALTLTSALGFTSILENSPKKLKYVLPVLISAIWLFNVAFFFNFYFGYYQITGAKSFQYGFNEAVAEAMESKKKYEYVIIDDRRDSALMNYLFMTNYDPHSFQSNLKSLDFELLQSRGDKLDNIILMKPGERNWKTIFKKNQLDKNYLLIVSSEQLNEEAQEKVGERLTENQKLLKVIYYKSGTPAFYVIESKQPKPI